MAVWRGLRQLASSLSFASVREAFKGTNKRTLQEQLDTHKLFLYTSLYAQRQAPGGLPEGFAEEIIKQAAELPFAEQKAAVQKQLAAQLLHQAAIIHEELLQAGDPAEAAHAFVKAQEQQALASSAAVDDSSWSQNHAGSSTHGWHSVSGASPIPASPSNSDRGGSYSSDSGSTSGSRAIGIFGSTSSSNAAANDKGLANGSSTSTRQMRIGQQELSERVGQRLGFQLQVRRSSIEHEEAGLGLFVAEGGEVPPGTLLALFPGLVYARTSYRRMPNYPKVDRDNPYLIARYDGRITDSRPWGRGALAPALDPSSHPLAKDEGGGTAGGVHKRRRGVVGRIVAASDGPVAPIPATQWVHATTGEAAQLESLLEGRHPLALAHFANHPGPGIAPNTMVASYSIRVHGTDEGKGGVGPWSRAYMPVMSYATNASHANLLAEEVHGVGLIALRALSGGEEVVFNYRLSPGLLGRPRWYVPVDEQEEDRRWG